MKSLIVTVFVIALSFVSCKKDSDPLLKPKADFSIGEYGGFNQSYADTAFIIGTHDALVLRNQSTNANAIIWNFGNGKTVTDNNPLLTYDSAGNYNVSLTAYNKNGTVSMTSKNIIVMERVLKSFSINNLEINKFAPSQNGLPIFTKINLWLEVKFSHSTSDTYTSNGDILAAVVYKSPVFTNIDSSFHSSINFALGGTEKVIINSPVNNYDYTSTGRGIIINLYGQDNSGTYLLSSSSWTGIQVLNSGNPAHSKNFGLLTFVAGSPTNVVLDCEYK